MTEYSRVGFWRMTRSLLIRISMLTEIPVQLGATVAPVPVEPVKAGVEELLGALGVLGVEPVPVEPVAVDPVPVEPVAVDPVPVEPVAVDPVPVVPVPVEPVEPVAVEPVAVVPEDV